MLLALLVAGLAAFSLVASDPCEGSTTIENNACFADRLAAAEAELERYDAAALTRLRDRALKADRGTPEAGLPAAFEKSRRAWAAYRDGECDAVYAYWSEGSIRTAMDLGCRIAITRRRTHTVWRHWLTYGDSTPSILPEPRMVADE